MKDLTLRQGKLDDAQELGQICYEAFRTISEAHAFPPDFPAPEPAIGLMEMMLGRGDIYSVVAESNGAVAGSNFLWEGDEVAGVGPITISPAAQNRSAGRQLMEDVLDRGLAGRKRAIRLVQAAYHNRSLALYTKLGFDTVEPLSLIQGPPVDSEISGITVRKLTASDVVPANELCLTVHGHGRKSEIAAAAEHGSGLVAEKEGKVTGYSTGIGFFGHTVGETNEELKALIAAADGFAGPGFLLPTRNSDLMRWCLENELRVVQPMTLMSRGFYQEPKGVFLPSILY